MALGQSATTSDENTKVESESMIESVREREGGKTCVDESHNILLLHVDSSSGYLDEKLASNTIWC